MSLGEPTVGRRRGILPPMVGGYCAGRNPNPPRCRRHSESLRFGKEPGMRRPLLAAILAVLAASTLLAIQASASAPVRRTTHPLQPHASTSVKVGLHDFFITRRPK